MTKSKGIYIRWNIDKCKKWIEENRPEYELLSTEYKNNKTKMLFQDKENNNLEFNMTWDDFTQWHDYKEKANNKLREDRKFNNGYLVEYANKYNFDIIDGLDEYKNTHSVLTFKCRSCGKEDFISFRNFKKRVLKCNNCYTPKEKRNLGNYKKSIYTLDFMKEEFKKRGYVLLATEYINAHIKMPYICSKHEEVGIQYIDWHHLSNNRGCKYCGFATVSDKLRLDGNTVYQAFTDNDLIPLFKPEDYKKSNIPLPYICLKHKDKGVQYKRYADIQSGKIKCWYCRNEYISDKLFKGTNSLLSYLRNLLFSWRKQSEYNNKFKCVITNNDEYDIHHIYSFNLITQELFDTYDIPLYVNINEYNDKERNEIKKHFLKLHNKYGNGICICESIHTLFHQQYGYGNNTKEQFKEFIKRLISKEFDEFLKENNLILNINYSVLNQYLN